MYHNFAKPGGAWQVRRVMHVEQLVASNGGPCLELYSTPGAICPLFTTPTSPTTIHHRRPLNPGTQMEEQAQSLLATLRKSSVPIETKLAAFNTLKSSIKHLRVPENSQTAIFECIKLAVSSQTSPTLVSTGFSTLGHLIKRLSLQEQTSIIASQANKLLPILLDRLGDPRESHRNAASQTLSDLWPYSHTEVEKTVREGAIAGHNSRAKEMGMLWVVKVRTHPYQQIIGACLTLPLLQMNRDQGLQFRSFVPHLVACLEDSDGGVRETAKSAVVELFR